MTKQKCNIQIIIAALLFLLPGLLFAAAAFVSPGSAVPAAVSIGLAVGLLVRNNIARILARCLGLFVTVICVSELMFCLYFLLTAPQFMYFEGGAGIKGFVGLLVFTPIMYWLVRVLNRPEIVAQFTKRNHSLRVERTFLSGDRT